MFETIISGDLTFSKVAICSAVSLGFGLVVALIYAYKNEYSKNLFVTLVLIPLIVQSIIMLVNGSLGTGVAVAGAFSLVRFRSAPGSSKDILYVFFAMAIGIATGIGQVVFAAAFALTACVVLLVINLIPVAKLRRDLRRQLRITVPEDLDFEREFKDIMVQFTTRFTIDKIKTSNIGCLFVVYYTVTLKRDDCVKAFIDRLRIVNGNHPIVFQSYVPHQEEF